MPDTNALMQDYSTKLEAFKASHAKWKEAETTATNAHVEADTLATGDLKTAKTELEASLKALADVGIKIAPPEEA